MKKQITSIVTTALVLTALTACSNSVSEIRTDIQSSASDSADATSSDMQIVRTESNPYIGDCAEPYCTEPSSNNEKCVFLDFRGDYGEVEIPDFHCDRVDQEGSVRPFNRVPIGLESMVFETRTFGDYTIKLVGENVRTDKENFPDTIYARRLYIEIENEKTPMSDNSRKIHYDQTILGQAQFTPEYRLFSSRIGSYLDIYDLEYPVIAMRYYMDDTPEYIDSAITKTVKFAMILPDKNDAVGLTGDIETGLGVVFNPDMTTDMTEIVTNHEDIHASENRAPASVLFKSDKLKAVDTKTLVDEAAGIRYVFDFTDIPLPGNFSNDRLTVEHIV